MLSLYKRGFPRAAILFVLFGFVSGCVTPRGENMSGQRAVLRSHLGDGVLNFGGATTDLTPIQAIVAAAERPEGVTGTFLMEVRRAGREGDTLYLNSEEDYRDQRCLTIAIPKDVASALERKVEGDPAVALKGKKIRVTGTAKRKTIWLSL